MWLHREGCRTFGPQVLNALIFLQLTSAILASWGQFRYIGRVEWLAGRCLAMHLYLLGVLEPAKWWPVRVHQYGRFCTGRRLAAIGCTQFNWTKTGWAMSTRTGTCSLGQNGRADQSRIWRPVTPTIVERIGANAVFFPHILFNWSVPYRSAAKRSGRERSCGLTGHLAVVTGRVGTPSTVPAHLAGPVVPNGDQPGMDHGIRSEVVEPRRPPEPVCTV